MAILRKLPAAVAVAALTVTLVGCGTSNIKDERDAAQMERDEAQAALEQTQSDLGQAQSDLEAAQAARTAAEADAAAAEQDRMDAEEAARMAAAQAEADAEAARTATEQAEADAAARMTAEEERDTAQEDLQAAREAMQRMADMEASDAAAALLGVLIDNALELDETTTEADDTVRAVPSIEVSVSSDGERMAEATDYTAALLGDPMGVWHGIMLENADDMDSAVIYTDVGDDGTVTLLDRYDSILPTSTAPRTWAIQAPGGSVADLIPWSAVERHDSEEMVMGGTPDAPTLTFQGYVHIVRGTFSCTGDTCSAPVRYSDNSVEGTTGATGVAVGDWTFVPDDVDLTYTDDMNYLVFGWWLSKGLDGNPDDFATITSAVMGGMAADPRTTASSAGTALRGSATYSGVAAGKYALAHTASDTHEGGHFTADAMLTADFDVDSDGAGDNDRNAIELSGTINNFMLADESRDDWTVSLTADSNNADDSPGLQPLANLGGDTGGALHAETTATTLATQWSTGGAQDGQGTWTVMFYGGDTGEAPTAATGTFNAHIGTTMGGTDTGAVARMQGAFGVNMDE